MLYLQLYLFFSRINVYIYKSQLSGGIKIPGWLTKTGRATFENRGIGEKRGLYYEINIQSIDLAESYYKQYLGDSFFVKFVNRRMRTEKFTCYVKKVLAYYFYEILNSLYLVKEFSENKKIMIGNSLPNKFVLDKFCVEHGMEFERLWVRFGFFYYCMPIIFIMSNLKQLFVNGFNYRNKIDVKLYRKAGWGLSREILRDDYLIDGIHFKKDDIIFYVDSQNEASNSAAQQLKERDYRVVDITKCKLNIKTGFLSGLFIFLIQPVVLAAILFSEKTEYFMEEMLGFYRSSLHHFLFLTNYRVRGHISLSDHGEIGETILMNRFGCKNLLYHWSDMTCTKAVNHAFTVHNIYYSWGPIHHDFQRENYYHDKVEIVGCILLKSYFDALLNLPAEQKTQKTKRILVCDTSFTNTLHLSEDFYLDFLDLTIDMLSEFPDVEFIFKSKNNRECIVNGFTNDERRRGYREKINFLLKNEKFVYYDNTIQLESLIAESDIVLSMSMNSPATIALILGKEGIYYDTTGNRFHPFVQYKNHIVFDDKKKLLGHVKDILGGKRSVFEYIDPDLLNRYEPYKDASALDRLIKSIHRDIDEQL